MHELNRNIPQDAILNADKSSQMRKVKREQFVARWGFRAAYLAGLYEIKDTLYPEVLNMLTLNIHDTRTFVITELVGIAVISSTAVGAHFEKQKKAIRINAVNRGLQREIPNYNPIMLPERHLGQYKDSANNIVDSFRRRFKV